MLIKAVQDFHIDLSQSWMVGDGENDIKAGCETGCHTALLVGEGTDAKRGYGFGQDMTCESLEEFVENGLIRVSAVRRIL